MRTSLPKEVLEQIIAECKEKNAHIRKPKPKVPVAVATLASQFEGKEIPPAVLELMRQAAKRKAKSKKKR